MRNLSPGGKTVPFIFPFSRQLHVAWEIPTCKDSNTTLKNVKHCQLLFPTNRLSSTLGVNTAPSLEAGC